MNAKLFWRGLAVLALAIGLAAPGQALVVIEVEPNDTLATAQFIDTEDTAIEVQGTRTFEDPSDDFFSWLVEHPGPLRIVSSSPDAFADSIMGLYGPGGGLLASNDDGGVGSFMSVIELLVSPSMTGLYTLGFSGFNPGLLVCAGGVTECYDTDDDFLFDRFVAGGGAGGSTGWDYTLAVSLASVPEPSTSLLFAVSLGLLLVFARTRPRARTAS